MHSEGCRMEEAKALLKLANDVVENTNKRRINVAQKPRRQSLIQGFGFLRKALRMLPRKMSPNQVMQEKRERAEHRLKLKMGSVFI